MSGLVEHPWQGKIAQYSPSHSAFSGKINEPIFDRARDNVEG
jgi:hypothetical protein